MQILSSFDKAATTSAVESLLVTPVKEIANRAMSTAVILRSSPMKSSPRSRRPHVSIANDEPEEKREDQSSSYRLAVDIQPRYDGTGIELVANNDDGSYMDADEGFSSYIRGSLLMVDPSVTAERLPMNLKILRGKNLPFRNARIRIGVLNREGDVDQIIGSTPSSEGSHDPIWGSRICSWTLNANHSTKLLFTLHPENPDERKNKVPATLCARASAADLLSKRNPNFWIMLKDRENPNNATSYGRIQIRLTRPTAAKLHKQENCLRITSGPAIPRMQSYAIRKMALYSCSPVMLNVYDVSNNPRIQTLNNTTKSFGYGGLFHAAIEIHGKEYSFGGTENKKATISGVFQCAPKQCPMHHYRESVFLGDCELNCQQIENILKGIRPKWLATSYNVFRKNCACFSRELAIELGVGDLPEWVFSLATTAESIEPYLNKLNTYLKNRTNTAASKLPSRKSITKRTPSKDFSTKKQVRIDSTEDIRAHEVAKKTQETLLDHAMAARIQRSFRASSVRRASMRRAKEFRNLQIPMVASA